MANIVVKHGLQMRNFFDVTAQSVAQWFPGHMAKGMTQMQLKLKSVDCIIEVHDARIPVSGRNPLFENRLLGIKPHLLLLNKMDLIDHKYKRKIIQFYETKGVKNIIFTNCKKADSVGIKSIIPKVSKLIQESERFNRSEESSYQVMIIGVPNVGKSSLINALRAKHLRRGKATPVGGIPGITQSVLERIKEKF
ncbi:Mitochondrial GTPase [Halocaridina rubra]|uniref:Mitochondrial GTPase n=1 Tax=Halocaridina rubra TaxID=373956 RepID=A0AAN8X2V5_HALRR